MKRFISCLISISIAISAVLPFSAPSAQAVTINLPARQAMVSLNFDDAYRSAYTNVLPILESAGFDATLFVATDWVGGTEFLNWDEIKQLNDIYGWEIGAHTKTHAELPTISATAVNQEFALSQQAFLSHGLNPISFATPFGAYNNTVLAAAARYYQSHRGFWDQASLNQWPYQKYLIRVKGILTTTTPAQVQTWLTEAINNREWLVLVFHEVLPATIPDDEYTYSITDFQAVVNEITASGISVKTIGQVMQNDATSLIANGSFENGLTGGWTTDRATNVQINSNNKGSWPQPLKSIRFVGASRAASHLFSPLFAVNHGITYAIESFINTNALKQGEFGLYVDEFDAAGNWVSGQWLGMFPNASVQTLTYLYQPSSTMVKNSRVQFYLTKSSSGNAFLDNVMIYAAAGSPEEPPVEPSCSIDSLAPNCGFEMAVDGWANEWTRRGDAFNLDTGAQGNDGQNSIHLTAAAATAHLFSRAIAINSSGSYVWRQYIKAAAVGAEFGFYIDEYDAAGNWISGQWKGMLSGQYTGTHEIAYTPTSAQVASIGLQYYALAGQYDLYLDSVTFRTAAL